MSQQRKGSETALIEPKSPCKNTVDLYLQECLHDDSIPSRVLASAYNKTVQRFVAENSHRAVIMMAIVVLMTHAIPTEDKSKECSGTLEDKLLWYPHFWVNPALCWQSDDTTYASAALKTKGIRVYIQKLCDTSAHFSTFVLDKKTQKCFVTIKSHVSAAIGDVMGPLILSMRCKERWWPVSVQQELIMIPIPGTHDSSIHSQ